MCYVLYVICYMLYVVCNMLYVICYMLYVICYMLCVAYYITYMVNEQADILHFYEWEGIKVAEELLRQKSCGELPRAII